MNIDIDIKEADSKLLFRLFKDFTDRLVHNTESLGIFTVDEDQPVFSNSDIKKVIKEMKS